MSRQAQSPSIAAHSSETGDVRGLPAGKTKPSSTSAHVSQKSSSAPATLIVA